MKLPAEIEKAIEMLYVAHRATGGPWVKDFAEALAYIVAEDCVRLIDQGGLFRAAIRQRYGLDENNNERAAAWKPPVNGT